MSKTPSNPSLHPTRQERRAAEFMHWAMKVFLLIPLISAGALVVTSARAAPPPEIPELCNPDGEAMFACARENEVAMQTYMDRLVNAISFKLPKADRTSFRKSQDKWEKVAWKKCEDRSDIDISYPEGKWAFAKCVTQAYLERARNLHRMYWKD